MTLDTGMWFGLISFMIEASRHGYHPSGSNTVCKFLGSWANTSFTFQLACLLWIFFSRTHNAMLVNWHQSWSWINISHDIHVSYLTLYKIQECKITFGLVEMLCRIQFEDSYWLTWARDSSVDIATGYRLDGPGIESRWGRDFSHNSRPNLGPTHPPVQWYRVFPRVKERPGRAADPSPPSSAVVMEE